jgi:hypothetical protein
MASGERRGNRESKKPKKVQPKEIAAAPPFANANKPKPTPGSGGKKS